MTLTSNSITVGDNASLLCEVTLGSNYSSVPVTITLELLNGSIAAEMVSSVSGDSRNTNFTIPNVGVFDAGPYQCRANVSYNGSNQEYVLDPQPVNSTPPSNLTVRSKF